MRSKKIKQLDCSGKTPRWRWSWLKATRRRNSWRRKTRSSSKRYSSCAGSCNVWKA
ncbi:unnamed protein product [Durusdinium trenchii]|uniref:Uncharacterized protein n=1 Tax=Durusdinium trenchii TaxID=1381693 RepID=A0ABP0QFX8_9DINO